MNTEGLYFVTSKTSFIIGLCVTYNDEVSHAKPKIVSYITQDEDMLNVKGHKKLHYLFKIYGNFTE